MPPRRRQSPPPLDVDQLRVALAAGRAVRVRIAPSSQFPDGATGRIRSMGDPAVDGAEFLSVEVGTGAGKDVLPFAPEDLQPWTRQQAGSREATGKAVTASELPRARPRPQRISTPGGPVAGPPTAGPADPVSSAMTTSTGSPGPAPAAPAEVAPSVEPAVTRTTRRGGGRSSAKWPAVSITIGTDGDTGWKVEARIGSRIAIRSAAVAPSRVAEIARQLGEPRLVTAVDGLLAEHRKAVQARADALAAELAALRDELDDLSPADQTRPSER